MDLRKQIEVSCDGDEAQSAEIFEDIMSGRLRVLSLGTASVSWRQQDGEFLVHHLYGDMRDVRDLMAVAVGVLKMRGLRWTSTRPARGKAWVRALESITQAELAKQAGREQLRCMATEGSA